MVEEHHDLLIYIVILHFFKLEVLEAKMIDWKEITTGI